PLSASGRSRSVPRPWGPRRRYRSRVLRGSSIAGSVRGRGTRGRRVPAGRAWFARFGRKSLPRWTRSCFPSHPSWSIGPEDLIHSGEAIPPESFVEAQPFRGLSERPPSDRVQVLPPVCAEGHHARVLEQPQLFRDGGLGHLGLADQIVDRSLPVTKNLEQVSPGRVREELKNIGHYQYMFRRIYIC